MIPERQLEDVKEFWEQHAINREGYRTRVYKDSLGKLTVGIGHLVTPEDNLRYGEQITSQRVFELFDKDSELAIDAAVKQALEAKCTTTDFIVALTSVNFQLGTKWNKPTKEGGKGFVNTWKRVLSRDIEGAIRGLRGSLWYRQTPVRVDDFIDSIRRLPQTPEVFTQPAPKPSFWKRFCKGAFNE